MINPQSHFLPFLPFGLIATMIIAWVAAIPATLLVMAAEWLKWRAAWIYCGFAMAAGLAIGLMFFRTEPWFPFVGLGLGLGFGLASGLSFWGIAGRNAGCLKASEFPRSQVYLMWLLGAVGLVVILMTFVFLR